VDATDATLESRLSGCGGVELKVIRMQGGRENFAQPPHFLGDGLESANILWRLLFPGTQLTQ
jgi:hypothetical protein